jgi:hypothetical protein
MGRPSKYSPELIEAICERLSKGEPLAAICRDEGMPGVQTVYDWINEREPVSVAIARAREIGEEAMLAECLEIAESPTSTTAFGSVDGGHIQEKKLRIDTRLKLLAKWNPKKWGDKVDLTSGGEKLPQVIVNVPPLPNGGSEQ